MFDAEFDIAALVYEEHQDPDTIHRIRLEVLGTCQTSAWTSLSRQLERRLTGTQPNAD
jgi:hypothetical protein